MEPGVIKKLDENVVNQIAAGEVIQRPANALKELIENCLDAKATNIEVTVKCGGMKMLQILDNGTGIRREDLEIVCERFTTSKLERFHELSRISTYGFRGEALSSISHVAHLRIQTKTRDSVCAYKAQYEGGRLRGDPVPCAGNQGTIITVEDLFYNTPQRRNTLRTPNDEYQLIYGVISKYAIHNHHVGFTLKKFGESPAIRTTAKSSVLDNIRVIYGNSVATELLSVEFADQALKFSARGFVSNGSHALKKGIFLLFINNRLVECETLRTALNELYSAFIPAGNHPFIYMSLQIDPLAIDVNIHPTKHEVRFLHEDVIVQRIVQKIEEKLLEGKSSKTFYTESRLPSQKATKNQPSTSAEPKEERKTTEESAKIVRTDSREVKIEKFFSQSFTSSPIITKSEPKAETSTKSPKAPMLTSILTLRKTVEDNCSDPLRKIINESSFVGAVDRKHFLIQSEDKMFLCDTRKLCQELFYQILLYHFRNFGKIELEEPLKLEDLAMMALDSEESGWTPEDGEKSDLVQLTVEILCEKAPIMKDYYNLIINAEDHTLRTLPLLLASFTPPMSYLPMFILRLATDVDWKSEKEGLESLSEEIARFYSEPEFCEAEEQVYAILEHILYPAMKEYLIPPRSFASNKAFLEVAALPELHKVFERC
ncbi:DNA mismatch repair protein Mlh1 [Phlebotomus argentipes]|uniref:DNA mismatch repair protein Mlh1 n=1 Tax=Phlebotomus argentipes TaxID=94469 RepID=UPI0028933EE9|nr:DNA mismatch repair protein Mlh1 [Phlebotomus argentipes]